MYVAGRQNIDLCAPNVFSKSAEYVNYLWYQLARIPYLSDDLFQSKLFDFKYNIIIRRINIINITN